MADVVLARVRVLGQELARHQDEAGRAAAAQPLPAALARAVEPELLAQHFDERLVRRDLRLDALAVQRELDRAPHLRCSASNTACGFSGSSVMRTPIASCTALATAGDT